MYKRQEKITIQKAIAILYLYLLPLRMIEPLSFLKSLVSVCANFFDLTLHIIGLFFLFIEVIDKTKSANLVNIREKQANKLKYNFIFTIVALNVISMFMALVLNPILGTLDGEDSIGAIITILVYYTHYALMIIYNTHIFKMFDKQEIFVILKRMINIVLFIGYIQLFTMLFGGPFVLIYNIINILGAFRHAEYFMSLQRLPLLFSEPAAAGGFIGVMVLPILLSEIIFSKKNRKAIFSLLLWLPLIYFTKSSTCYLLVVIAFIAFLIFYSMKFRKVRWPLITIATLGIVFTLLIFFVEENSILFNNGVIKTIKYYFNKISDLQNESTVTRIIPTFINFRIFAEYPIMGIGNGNQGFFYKEYFPSWGHISQNTYDKIVGVADGGVAIPSLFSGYGLVGVILVFIYFYNATKTVKDNKDFLGVFYYIYLLSSIVIFVNGFQSDYFGLYYVFFMLSIPMMVNCKDQKQQLKD